MGYRAVFFDENLVPIDHRIPARTRARGFTAETVLEYLPASFAEPISTLAPDPLERLRVHDILSRYSWLDPEAPS